MNDLIENIDRLHTTEMGSERIKKNLRIDTDDVVEWCRAKILDKNAEIEKNGKKLVYSHGKLQDNCKFKQLYNNYGA